MNFLGLTATLGLDKSNYDKGLNDAESSASSFGSKLKTGLKVAAGLTTAALTATTAAAVASSKAFVNAAKSTAQTGDVVDKQSQKVGFSAKSWQEWDYVLKLAGADMQSATMGIKTMTNQVSAAKKGNKEAVANFKALGISVKDLKNMSREDIFEKVISSLQKMPESANRAALANKLLGRSGQELTPLFNMTNEETKKAIKTANDYGMVMNDKAVKASANFQDSLTTLQGAMSGLKNNMMSNFLPSLTTVMDGLSQVFSGKNSEEGMKKIEVGIMTLIDKLQAEMPKFMELGKTIIVSVLKGFAPMLPSLVSTIFDIGIQAITTVVSMVPQMMPTIITGIQGMMNALMNALPVIINGVTQLLMSLVQWLADESNVKMVVSGVVQLVTQLVNSFAMILPILLPAIATIIGELAKALTEPDTVMMLLDAILTIIGALAVGIIKALPILAKAVLDVIKNLGELLSRFFEWAVPIAAKGIEGIVNTVKSWGNAVKTFVLNLINNIKTAISNWITNLKSSFVDGFNNIRQNISNIINNIGKFVSDLFGKLKELPSKVVSLGSDVVKGLWNGISNMSKWIANKIKGFGESVVNGLKKFFKISSPSKLFRDQIGKFLAMGLGEGFENAMPDTVSGMVSAAKKATDEISNAMVLDDVAMTVTPNTTNEIPHESAENGSSLRFGSLVVNVYGAEGQDIRELAKEVSREIQNMIADKEKVYA